MRLACEGCGAVLEEETADALHTAMMAHGQEAHPVLLAGKSPAELEQTRQRMDAHVRQMIADQN
jgi:acyl transferase domain-containing protein